MSSLRRIPSIDALSQREDARVLEERYGRSQTLEALRAAADAVREQLAEGVLVSEPAAAILAAAGARLRESLAPSLRPVVNATGVVLHTNLGRAPLSPAAASRLAAVASGYSNLEFDLATGSRGSRNLHAEALLRRLTGAEAALVVNNTAAATLLALSAMARGREVVISRGELVEIGGGFRVPDVMAQSGARLREVGTTNRTRLADYAAAVGERTAAILRVHPSNFRVTGFTERPALADLVALGGRCGVPVLEDVGSGYTGWSDLPGLSDEPDVRRSLASGVALVMFSGDKLLGGPQAGVLAGQRTIVDRLRRHPLLRAVRVDKLTLAALEATLLDHLTGRTADVPVPGMIALTPAAIATRAAALAAALAALPLSVRIVPGASTIGGGSAPELTLPTHLVALRHASASAAALAAALRRQDPPVVARVEDDWVLLDLRTVVPSHDPLVADLVARACSES